MKSLKAKRIRVKIGDIWESPELHILLTQENDVVVARCLDFTVSSHGTDIKNALNSLADSIKEYILTAVENDAINTIYDSAHSKYWRMFNELETKHSYVTMKRSLKKSLRSISYKNLEHSPAEINYA
ncbi:MAG: hypothetical protein SRB2_01642 [Desulfobacteraceae bacterium Eth-SRB2]|nr:MAG: hypothetical protein SRB2_01642 [Desulfobacteraceae bacterium Eth-SRB2]